MESTIINLFQVLCILLIFPEYLSQLIKVLKTKNVTGISLTFWYVKMSIAFMQFTILVLAGNDIMVYLSQLIGLVLGTIVLISIMFYKSRGDKNDTI